MSTTKKTRPSRFIIKDFNSTTIVDDEIQITVSAGSKEVLNEDDELYNPFGHRHLDHPTSTLGALIHLLKSALGSGILAVPNAFKNAGLLFGVVGTVIVGVLCAHAVHILVKASHKICKESKTPSMDFSETTRAAFKYGPKPLQPWASFAEVFVDISLAITYYMGGVVYVVFISESIKQLVDYYFPECKLNILWYILFILGPLILACQIRQLKYLVPFSFLANLLMGISIGIILYYMFTDIQHGEKRNLFSPINQLPLFFSTVIFAIEGIGVVMPLENTMKKPERFLGRTGVLNMATSIIVVLYAIFGFFGYLKYGEETAGSITFNLPVEETPAQVVRVLVTLAVFFSFGLQFHVAIDITWRKTLEKRIPRKHHNIAQIVIRSLIVIITAGVAALVPDLEPIIGLVGSICFATLGIFVPAVVDTVISWKGELGFLKWKLFKNIILASSAIFALVLGTFTSCQSFWKN